MIVLMSFWECSLGFRDPSSLNLTYLAIFELFQACFDLVIPSSGGSDQVFQLVRVSMSKKMVEFVDVFLI